MRLKEHIKKRQNRFEPCFHTKLNELDLEILRARVITYLEWVSENQVNYETAFDNLMEAFRNVREQYKLDVSTNTLHMVTDSLLERAEIHRITY
jgi:hypothetical protein